MSLRISFQIILLILVVNSLSNALDSDSDPRSNPKLYDILIKEDVKFDTIIGNVGEILVFRKTINNTGLINKYKLIYFSPYMPQSSENNERRVPINSNKDIIFSIEPDTGNIRLKSVHEKTLEYLCQNRKLCSCGSCIFNLNVIYSTSNKISADTIRIFIDDVNKEKPEFYTKSEILTVNISESSPIGYALQISDAAAQDSDAYYNKISYYLLYKRIDDKETIDEMNIVKEFKIQQDEKEAKSLILSVNSALDFETKSSYEFYLVAQDNGIPVSLRNSKKIFINIIDENDNVPQFEQNFYQVKVPENFLAKNIMQVKATDADSGLNGQVEYYFNEENDLSDHTDFFHLDKNSGWLSVVKPIDFESVDKFVLNIVAQDKGVNNALRAYAKIEVTVLDINDNKAEFILNKFLNESAGQGYYEESLKPASDVKVVYQMHIYENNRENMVLATIAVNDRDSNGVYSFQVDNEDLFKIERSKNNENEYELIVLKSLDYERSKNIQIMVNLMDKQEFSEYEVGDRVFKNEEKSFNSSMKIMLNVLDLNDNAPFFKEKFYRFTAKENQKNVKLNKEHEIVVVDFDSKAVNGDLTYHLIENPKYSLNIIEYLSVETSADYEVSTGINSFPVISLLKAFDYEIDGSLFEFELIVLDKDQLSSRVKVQIEIEDVNDNAPVLTNANTTFSIAENMPVNTFITQILASDMDSKGPNSEISYRISSGISNSFFSVINNGILFSKVSFDYEIENYYEVTIEASDHGKPPLSSTAVYIIRIEDVNDNYPKFVFPKENTRFMQHKIENFAVDSDNLVELFSVTGEDLDSGNNSKLIYSLHDSAGILTINKTTGVVSLKYTKDMGEKFKSIVDISLTVSDCGTIPLKSSLNFTLYLNYEASEIPENIMEAMHSDERMSTLNGSHPIKFLSEGPQHFFQIVSNSVLIVILLVVLTFMVLVACFILITACRRNSKSKKDKSSVVQIDVKSISTNSSQLSIGDCISHVKECIKSKYDKSPMGTLNFFRQPMKNANLSVKDTPFNEIDIVSTNESKSDFDTVYNLNQQRIMKTQSANTTISQNTSNITISDDCSPISQQYINVRNCSPKDFSDGDKLVSIDSSRTKISTQYGAAKNENYDNYFKSYVQAQAKVLNRHYNEQMDLENLRNNNHIDASVRTSPYDNFATKSSNYDMRSIENKNRMYPVQVIEADSNKLPAYVPSANREFEANNRTIDNYLNKFERIYNNNTAKCERFDGNHLPTFNYSEF